MTTPFQNTLNVPGFNEPMLMCEHDPGSGTCECCTIADGDTTSPQAVLFAARLHDDQTRVAVLDELMEMTRKGTPFGLTWTALREKYERRRAPKNQSAEPHEKEQAP